MDNTLLNSHLHTLDELIVEADKIVTYKSLSKILGIHTNTSKQLLYAYLAKQKNEKSFPICATYLLAGRQKNGSLEVTVINEADKEIEISKFVEITSEHVYSIQKGKSLKDIKVLYGIGKEIQNTESSSVIQFKSLAELKNKQTCFAEVEDGKEEIQLKKSETATDPIKEKSEYVVQNEALSKSSEETCINENKLKTDKKQEAGQSDKNKGSIAHFFPHGTVQKAPQKCGAQIDESQKKLEQKVISPKEEKANVKNKKFKSSRKENEAVKRKRIEFYTDSDDSSCGSEDEAAPVENPEPIIEQNAASFLEDEDKPQNKRKKRKIIDVTVINDDGYLETRKEVTFATDSEEEPEIVVLHETIGNHKPAKNTKKLIQRESKSKERRVRRLPNKQLSLLNFMRK